MKKFVNGLIFVLVLSMFSFMALASGSSSKEEKETKKIVGDESGVVIEGDDEVVEETNELVTINEQVLLDSEGIKITAKEYVEDSFWGEGIKILIENSTDKNIMVGCTALIVNNYNISDLFAADVAAGMNANETIYLSSNELEAAGIDTVGKVEIYFHIYDDDTWDKIFDSECITVETSAVNDADYSAHDDGYELYNDNDIRIVGKAVDEDSFWGTGILLYIENNTDRNIVVQADNMAINGFMVTPYFSCDVYGHRMAIDDISILRSELEENDITEINKVSLSFRIHDSDTYDTIVNTETIEFSVE